MISTANITMQFGAKPLFENISAKFGNGNRYGMIGANGCGKSTLMKILSGELAPTSGNVSITPGNKVGTLSQDQFAFEEHSVINTVIMGDVGLWKVKQERDRIYSLPEMSEADGMRVADLEAEFAEMDGYSAESRAGEILLQAGIDEALHYGLMKQVAPGVFIRGDRDLGHYITGGAEVLASVASSAVAEPVAGLAGIGAELMPGGKTGAEAVAASSVRSKRHLSFMLVFSFPK